MGISSELSKRRRQGACWAPVNAKYEVTHVFGWKSFTELVGVVLGLVAGHFYQLMVRSLS